MSKTPLRIWFCRHVSCLFDTCRANHIHTSVFFPTCVYHTWLALVLHVIYRDCQTCFGHFKSLGCYCPFNYWTNQYMSVNFVLLFCTCHVLYRPYSLHAGFVWYMSVNFVLLFFTCHVLYRPYSLHAGFVWYELAFTNVCRFFSSFIAISSPRTSSGHDTCKGCMTNFVILHAYIRIFLHISIWSFTCLTFLQLFTIVLTSYIRHTRLVSDIVNTRRENTQIHDIF